jgi:hypothetical protein
MLSRQRHKSWFSIGMEPVLCSAVRHYRAATRIHFLRECSRERRWLCAVAIVRPTRRLPISVERRTGE